MHFQEFEGILQDTFRAKTKRFPCYRVLAVTVMASDRHRSPHGCPASPLAPRPLGLLQHAVLAWSLLRGLDSALCCFSNSRIVYILHVSQCVRCAHSSTV